MPRINNYFSDEEHEFIKKQDKGFIRGLVQEVIGVPDIPVPKKIVKHKIRKIENIGSLLHKTGDGKTTCKKCGALLTTYKGKCKIC